MSLSQPFQGMFKSGPKPMSNLHDTDGLPYLSSGYQPFTSLSAQVYLPLNRDRIGPL